MFLFKKILSQFFFPLPVTLMICYAGLALLWWTKRQKTGKILVTTGLLLLTLLSYSAVSDLLLVGLEHRYPMYESAKYPPVKFVVVLGGGSNDDPQLPLSSQIGDDTLKRLVEGIRIQRENPSSKLVLSGGNWLGAVPVAKTLCDVAKMLGVDERNLLSESESRDTKDEARILSGIVTTNRFVLVTSASHLPRAMALFRKQGLDPIPAPTEHLVQRRPFTPGSFFPNSRGIWKSERATYEHLGLVWGRLSGAL